MNNSVRTASNDILSLKPEFCKLLVGLPLTSAEKDKLRHAVFFPQFRFLLRGNLNSKSAHSGSEVVEQRQQPDAAQPPHKKITMFDIEKVHTAAAVEPSLQLGGSRVHAPGSSRDLFGKPQSVASPVVAPAFSEHWLLQWQLCRLLFPTSSFSVLFQPVVLRAAEARFST